MQNSGCRLRWEYVHVLRSSALRGTCLSLDDLAGVPPFRKSPYGYGSESKPCYPGQNPEELALGCSCPQAHDIHSIHTRSCFQCRQSFPEMLATSSRPGKGAGPAADFSDSPCSYYQHLRKSRCSLARRAVLTVSIAAHARELVHNSLSPGEDGAFVKAISLWQRALTLPKKNDPSSVVTSFSRMRACTCSHHVVLGPQSRETSGPYQRPINDFGCCVGPAKSKVTWQGRGSLSTSLPFVCCG